MTSHLSQRLRFGLLVVDVAILIGASWLAFGYFWPSNDDKGIWFYTALLGLLLGARLDTPFFVTPAGVFLYAAPAAVALLLANGWTTWQLPTRVAFSVALGFCAICGTFGAAAILTHRVSDERWQRISNACRILAETLGTPRLIYSFVVAFAIFAFHRQSAREFATITAAWLLTGVFSPLENGVLLVRRIRRALHRNSPSTLDGEVVAFQTPGLLLVRRTHSGAISPGVLLAIRDVDGSAKMALALDLVGRDEGVLVRALEVSADPSLTEDFADSTPNSVVCLPNDRSDEQLVTSTKSLVGLVAPDSSIERLYFEVVADDELEEGRLVEASIRDQPVLYQVVNGLTREEIIRQRNTHGFARAQAQKIGTWKAAERRFVIAKWLPRPNAPVYLRKSSTFVHSRDAIGHLPGTEFEVRLKGVSSLVTHNTAILGILGVGKSSLAFELVERILAEGIKVICVDVTGEYEEALSPFIDREKQQRAEEVLLAATTNGKTNYQRNVEEGGSRSAFAAKLGELIAKFLGPQNETARLLVINPAQFDVWRQDSKMFDNRASMASVSAAEITQMVAEASLEAVTELGIVNSARLCVVLEEAHSLVPEWNSTIAEGDRTASNGTSRAILQGRKYGMGCLLITQRTANVTKTILNQCNTIFAMRTFDETGKGFLANYVGSDYADALPSLSERQAVFYGKASSCENPVLIRLNDRLDFIRTFRDAVSANSSVVTTSEEETNSDT